MLRWGPFRTTLSSSNSCIGWNHTSYKPHSQKNAECSNTGRGGLRYVRNAFCWLQNVFVSIAGANLAILQKPIPEALSEKIINGAPIEKISLVVQRRVAHEINKRLLALRNKAFSHNFQMFNNLSVVVPAFKSLRFAGRQRHALTRKSCCLQSSHQHRSHRSLMRQLLCCGRKGALNGVTLLICRSFEAFSAD